MLNKIPQSELEVMKVIWENKEPVSSKIVTTKLEDLKGWKRTTTLTLLSRLVEKGFLEADKTRRLTYYTSNINKKEYEILATKVFIKDVFNGNIERTYEVIKEIKEEKQ